jgi:hypothetical protein
VNVVKLGKVETRLWSSHHMAITGDPETLPNFLAVVAIAKLLNVYPFTFHDAVYLMEQADAGYLNIAPMQFVLRGDCPQMLAWGVEHMRPSGGETRFAIHGWCSVKTVRKGKRKGADVVVTDAMLHPADRLYELRKTA